MNLTISNHGPLITATNYWRTDAATAGNLYLSINAGAFRLLVPPLLETIVPDLATGRLPLDEDAAKEWIFTVWTRPRRLGDRPHKALERVARYRRVDVLPWLKPWEGK